MSIDEFDELLKKKKKKNISYSQLHIAIYIALHVIISFLSMGREERR